ncbi:hypothetical protein E4T56_gene17435 [Termitomyces sp. T112]|nr:hypothetical protein E4T56_gene17435 [Termitomyces sp. T112]
MVSITWAYTIAIVFTAFIGKFGGCSLAEKYAAGSWRESAAIGSLMSCKGLVELIVLNVGLSAGILTRVVLGKDKLQIHCKINIYICAQYSQNCVFL